MAPFVLQQNKDAEDNGRVPAKALKEFSMNRNIVATFAAFTMMFTAGCATKNYVTKEMTPLINKTNELDEITARNTRDIRDVDARAQKGISDVNTKSETANQKALAAGKVADEAQQTANQAVTGVNALTNTVVNLDNYHPVTEATVHFGFDRAELTKKAKDALDQLANEVPGAQHYILEVTGNTDSTGAPDYNYNLSQRRAFAVIQYMAQAHNISAHKFYIVGLGKDKPAASNNSVSGRQQNRRVDIRLMTNTSESPSSAKNTTPAAPNAAEPPVTPLQK